MEGSAMTSSLKSSQYKGGLYNFIFLLTSVFFFVYLMQWESGEVTTSSVPTDCGLFTSERQL